MKQGETVYIGDGAYMHFTGWSFEFRANHHEHPTDRVSIEDRDVPTMLHHILETMGRHSIDHNDLKILNPEDEYDGE